MNTGQVWVLQASPTAQPVAELVQHLGCGGTIPSNGDTGATSLQPGEGDDAAAWKPRYLPLYLGDTTVFAFGVHSPQSLAP